MGWNLRQVKEYQKRMKEGLSSEPYHWPEEDIASSVLSLEEFKRQKAEGRAIEEHHDDDDGNKDHGLVSGKERRRRQAAKKAEKARKAAETATRRQQASSSKQGLLNSLFGVKTAQASEGEPSGTSRPSPKPLGRTLQILSDPFGLRPKARSAGFDVPSRPDVGVSRLLGLDKYIHSETPPSVLGVEDVIPEITPEPIPEPTPKPTPRDYDYEDYDYEEEIGGGGGGVNKGLEEGGDEGYSDYEDSLNKSLEGYGSREKSAKKQIESLIRSLDPEYDAYKKQAEQEMERSKIEDINKLVGLMAAYNTADSEQRMQAQERVQSDYGSKLSDLLAKLSLQKQKDVTGYKEQGFNLLDQIAEAKQGAQMNVAELLQQARESAWDRDYKNRSLSSRYRQPTTEPYELYEQGQQGQGFASTNEPDGDYGNYYVIGGIKYWTNQAQENYSSIY